MMQNFRNKRSVQKCAQNAGSNVLKFNNAVSLGGGVISYAFTSNSKVCDVVKTGGDIYIEIWKESGSS